LKIDNILINKISEKHFDVKIADFGLAKKLPSDGTKLYDLCGSPGYIAPEILKG
jgi:serine/threonine protein kinase